MERKLIGTRISSFGFGVIVSSIVHPLGLMESQSAFYLMLVGGAALLLGGRFLEKTGKANEVTNTKSQ